MTKADLLLKLKGVHSDTEIIFVMPYKNTDKHFEVENFLYLDDALTDTIRKKAIYMQVNLKAVQNV